MTDGRKADLIILGNVITMDDRKPSAEAVAVKGDRILYVGAAEVAKKLCDADTKVYDFGTNTIYPGFLEAHCHPGGAGYMSIGVAQLQREADYEANVRIVKEYIDANPDIEDIHGYGFTVLEEKPTAAMLDAICADKPIDLTDLNGHSMWLNTAALKKYGIDRSAVEKWGTDCVEVDENGDPTGYIAENPVFHVRAHSTVGVDILKKSLLMWQDFALSMGYTGVYNAGVNITSDNEALAYHALEKEGLLKHYTFAGRMMDDNTETPEEDIDKLAAEAAEHNSRHYRIIGAKTFCDGTVEAHTAWMIDDYRDQPGYKGISRFDDPDKIVRLVRACEKHGLNVHVHAIGNQANKLWAECFAQVEEETGNFDMRNAIAHLQCVEPEVVRRIGEYNIIPVAGMLWVMLSEGERRQTDDYIGPKWTKRCYPIKDFLDAGAALCSHSDFPVSPAFTAPGTICLGVSGKNPSLDDSFIRHPDQHISRMDAMKAITTNVAYSWHQEHEMGSLEIGKLANITVFDSDFLRDDLAEVETAKCLATFVDGELVYKA
jgi:hypothetical protein